MNPSVALVGTAEELRDATSGFLGRSTGLTCKIVCKSIAFSWWVNKAEEARARASNCGNDSWFLNSPFCAEGNS